MKYLQNLPNVNVASALIRAFVECYESYKEKKVGYVSEFSRQATICLHNTLRCEKIKELLQRAENYINGLYEEVARAFDAVFMIDIVAKTRLTIHTENPLLPLEISIAWDPYTNLPSVPSSSLKGVVRSWIELYVGKSIDGISLDDIFGSSEKHVSLVVFSDAYPVSCQGYLIEPDVTTPHYSTVKPAISEPEVLPTPIVFPTIAPNTTLRFIMAFRYKLEEGKELINAQIVGEVVDYALKALGEGIGAKTNIGYGRVKTLIKQESVKQKCRRS